MKALVLAASLGLSLAMPAAAQKIERVERPAKTRLNKPLPMRVNGRVLPEDGGAAKASVQRQWPGTYFETAFTGSAFGFRVGPGEVHLHVTVDDKAPISLLRPQPGLYRISGLSARQHRVRVDVVNENQDGPTRFDGFYGSAETRPSPLSRRSRQIEFIGDSHTVGYGNTSAVRSCTPDEVWRTTDTAQGIAARVANRFGADYQVNAISGRGIVRNYNGGAGDPLPQAYPFVLFDKEDRYAGAGWTPQVIVIALGTNDFSTALNPGERWATRAALHADFERTYVSFVQALRQRNPAAHFVLWATDGAEGEIQAEVRKVVAALKASGEQRVTFVPVNGLKMSGCDFHPGLADDETIARAIAASLEADPAVWAADF